MKRTETARGRFAVRRGAARSQAAGAGSSLPCASAAAELAGRAGRWSAARGGSAGAEYALHDADTDAELIGDLADAEAGPLLAHDPKRPVVVRQLPNRYLTHDGRSVLS